MTIGLNSARAFLQDHGPALYGLLADWRDARGAGEAELALLPWLCPGGTVALDIGANSGTYTYQLLRRAARVVAFEPNPRLCAVLRSRFRRALVNGRLRLESVAVSDVAGDAELFIPHALAALASVDPGVRATEVGRGVGGRSVRVPTRTLDECTRDLEDGGRVGFIKIDVEGHELAVIDGALALLARDRPTLLIEAEERHHLGTVEGLRQRLAPLGYHGAYLHEGRLWPLERFDAARLQDRAALNAAGTRRRPGRTYINNFIFRQTATDPAGEWPGGSPGA